jgi:ribosome-associated protein
MLIINRSISLDEGEIVFDQIRASGPGGQNVNKVSTAIQLRFDLRSSLSIPQEVKDRLSVLAVGKITTDGILIIDARRFRTQAQNRADALARLTHLIEKSMEPPRKRRPSQPTQASKIERLQTKKRHSNLKNLRHKLTEE